MRKLKAFEDKNAKLKKLVTNVILDNALLKGLALKQMVALVQSG